MLKNLPILVLMKLVLAKAENGEKKFLQDNNMQKLPPIHPGEVLLEDFMKPLGLSKYRVAKDIGVPALRISQIVRGQRSITVDTAMRLARYFGTSAAIWLLLQARYDLEIAETKMAKRVNRLVKVLHRGATSVVSLKSKIKGVAY